MATKPLIKESLLVLNPIGVDPHISNVLSNLRLVLSVITMLTACIDSLLDLLFKWRGLNSMESIMVFTGFLQVLTKVSILVTHRETLAELLNKIDQFWPANKCGAELQTVFDTIYTFGRNTMKFMVMFLIIGATGFFTLSIFLTSEKLPFPLYHATGLNGSPDYEIALGLETLAAIIAVCGLVGFDFLFVSLIINITCELKMVKEALGNIHINNKIRGDTEESLRELYKIIEHHNLILVCTKTVRTIYSFWLLNIYFYNMVNVCVCLLCIIATGFPPSFESIAMYGFITIFYMIQLFFYCAVGQYLIAESESVSAAVYETDWWIKTQPELRRAVVLMIQRANKAEQLTAGGMFALDLSSFTTVTRSALSFFMIVKALYNDN